MSCQPREQWEDSEDNQEMKQTTSHLEISKPIQGGRQPLLSRFPLHMRPAAKQILRQGVAVTVLRAQRGSNANLEIR